MPHMPVSFVLPYDVTCEHIKAEDITIGWARIVSCCSNVDFAVCYGRGGIDTISFSVDVTRII